MLTLESLESRDMPSITFLKGVLEVDAPVGGCTVIANPTSVPGEVSHMAISADGRMLAFVAPNEKTGMPMLSVQRVGAPAATELAGTEGASYPFWSPDNASVAFFANSKLQKVSVSGGSEQTLAKVNNARGGSWGSKNVILYSPDPGGPIWRVNADGGHSAPLTINLLGKADSNRWPMFLPWLENS